MSQFDGVYWGMINQQDIDHEDFDRWFTCDFLHGLIDTEEGAAPFDVQVEEILHEATGTPQGLVDALRNAFIAGKEVPK